MLVVVNICTEFLDFVVLRFRIDSVARITMLDVCYGMRRVISFESMYAYGLLRFAAVYVEVECSQFVFCDKTWCLVLVMSTFVGICLCFMKISKTGEGYCSYE